MNTRVIDEYEDIDISFKSIYLFAYILIYLLTYLSMQYIPVYTKNIPHVHINTFCLKNQKQPTI
jgi:hypothetical protein